MSINSEISRIDDAKADIKEAIEGKGVPVPSATKIDGMAVYINKISTGGEECYMYAGRTEPTDAEEGDLWVDCSDESGGTLITKTITENGIYNASGDNADGYSSVTVNVPGDTLITKVITENGTYDASSDNADGYSSVTINVSGGEIVYTDYDGSIIDISQDLPPSSEFYDKTVIGG